MAAMLQSNNDPTIVELIEGKGYIVEEHSVTTEDGFILTVHRIPSGRRDHHLPATSATSSLKRPVVYLQHGIADSAATWVMNEADQSLGTILADDGYDVWLGNSRGNTYSLRHKTLDASDPDFWSWSWDELQKYDLPAVINYILSVTRQPQLDYIGHSQGTTIAFAAFSSNQHLANKIKKFIALAPVATVGYVGGAARLALKLFPMMKPVIGKKEFAPNSDALRLLAAAICSFPDAGELCQEVANLVGGHGSSECDATRFDTILKHFPAGTSVQNVEHFYQMRRNRKMTCYDFGTTYLNQIHYDQATPPEYDLSRMKVPTYLFSGSNDFLADTKDVQWLVSKLPKTSVVLHEIKSGWNHLDFVWGVRDAPKLYKRIADILRG